MKEKLILAELLTQEFRTNQSTHDDNVKIARRLGTNPYVPARLAIALSLADKKRIEIEVSDNTRTGGNGIRGRYLFGKPENMAPWIALITQHAEQSLTSREFSIAVAKHWERGIKILKKVWEDTNGDFDEFIIKLSERCGLVIGQLGTDPVSVPQAKEKRALDAVELLVGRHASGDENEDEETKWKINASGHPPHIAIMGSSGTGKTELALKFIKEITLQSGCPAFVFDMKGDMSAKIKDDIGAKVIQCPQSPVPLDILHVSDPKNNYAVQNAATNFCLSLARVVTGNTGSVQNEHLRKTLTRVIRSGKKASIGDLKIALDKHYKEENIRADSITSALDQICDLNLFVPDQSPSEFFGRSQIFVIDPANDGIQKFVALMILDALDRYFMGLSEAKVDNDDNRRMSALLVVDEAHKILQYNHPAVSNILRLSRSKGGAAMLISQSPNDYMQQDRNFLENIGLTICYQTNATPASVKKVFMESSVGLSRLEKGTCYARFSGSSNPVRKIKVWG